MVMCDCNLNWIAGISYTIASYVSYLSLSFLWVFNFFPFTCSVTVHFSMLMVASSCKKKIHHFQGNLVRRTRHKQIICFILKHSDCCERKVVNGKEGPVDMGQHCSQPASFSALRIVLIVPAPTLLIPTDFLGGSKGLSVQAQIM